jgi:hypothetical protein
MTEQAAVDVATKSNPFAELVAWVTLLDAWSIVGFAVILLCLTWVFWRLQKGESRFNFGDAFIDNTTGQTSYLRIIIFGCFVFAWSVVMVYVVRGQDIPTGLATLIPLILGIFVTNIIANRGFEVFDPRVKAQAINAAPSMANQPDPPQQQGGDITIKTEVGKT